jgi:CDP-diacylglycerol--glycerol-3-phosphate 3-phosphatidyltransferase
MYGLWWTSFILYTLAAVSDFVDGWLARKYNATSKIGGVLDHIGDKFLVANTLIMLAIMSPAWPVVAAWMIIVPTIILISRELYVSGLREFVGTQKMEMPVPSARFSMGKIKAFLQMTAAGAFLLWIAIMSLTYVPTWLFGTTMLAVEYLPYLGTIVLWAALVASLWSAIEYTSAFAKKFKKVK